MWIKPATLVGGAVSLGALALGVLLFFHDVFATRYRWLILAGYLVGWYVFTIWLILPVAVIAQSVRNKRHGVFSHLRRSSLKDIEAFTRSSGS